MSSNSQPLISPSDRLGFTLFLAGAVHAMVIFGIGFKPSNGDDQDLLPSLDIIVANSRSLIAVDDPDYLAQVDQAGGGAAADKARPSAPVSAPTLIDQQGLSDQERVKLQQQQSTDNERYLLTQTESDTQVQQKRQQRQSESNQDSASDVEQHSTRIAKLQAEIRDMTVAYAKRPKTLTLTASTKKAIEASYLAAWVKRIERTGNLNYPHEARIKKLDGRLRMSVWLNAAGEVLDIKITKSSGSSVLDAAAKQILRMAQPFAPFPDELRERTDQIVIIRTWDFKSNRFKTESGVS